MKTTNASGIRGKTSNHLRLFLGFLDSPFSPFKK